MPALFIGCIRVSPAEIVIDGTGEKNVVLQYHRHFVTKCVKVVGADIFTANVDGTSRYIIQTADQVD